MNLIADRGLSSYRCDVIVNHEFVSFYKRSDMLLSIVDSAVMGSIPDNFHQAQAINDDKETRPGLCKHTVRSLSKIRCTPSHVQIVRRSNSSDRNP